MITGLPPGFPDGPLLVLAPHFDDEILGCGGLLASLPGKAGVRVVFACDGRGSAGLPRPAAPAGAPDIAAVRAKESLAALALAGVPAQAVRFLDFPDGSLAGRGGELREALRKITAEVKPAWILAPFRFDRHPDHIALGRAALDLPEVREGRAGLLEYFVYYRFRLFPGGDIRRVVREEFLARADLGAETAALKRRALDVFVSQVTRYFPWQARPVLQEDHLCASAAGPELFLRAPAGASDGAVLRWPPWLVRGIMEAEHRFKRASYAWRARRRIEERNAHD